MAGILRGDIVWADLEPSVGNEQSGCRPVLVISNTFFNECSRMVIAFALTSKPQRSCFPFSWELSNVDLPKKTWVKMSQIRTLSIRRLKGKISSVAPEELEQIISGFNEIISE
jgi:mRNA interferase MazF